MTASEIYSPGLEGVIAGETAISTVEGGLRYRGYPVGELAEHCSFDEVAYLLLYGELPTGKQLDGFLNRVAVARDGNFYIADAGGSRIRRVGTDGVITT